MARPKAGYKLPDGTKVPGCTTIAKFGEPADALIGWANRIGREHGCTTHEFLRTAQDAGTLAHEYIEAYLRRSANLEPSEPSEDHPSEIKKLAEKALESFKRWADDRQLEVIDMEVPLVSKVYRFGGTYDLLCKMFGKYVTLADWKTSNSGPYPAWVLQQAGYRLLCLENKPDLVIERHLTLKIGKEDATFQDFDWGEGNGSLMTDAVEAFIRNKRAYDAYRKLTKKGRI